MPPSHPLLGAQSFYAGDEALISLPSLSFHYHTNCTKNITYNQDKYAARRPKLQGATQLGTQVMRHSLPHQVFIIITYCTKNITNDQDKL